MENTKKGENEKKNWNEQIKIRTICNFENGNYNSSPPSREVEKKREMEKKKRLFAPSTDAAATNIHYQNTKIYLST